MAQCFLNTKKKRTDVVAVAVAAVSRSTTNEGRLEGSYLGQSRLGFMKAKVFLNLFPQFQQTMMEEEVVGEV